MTRCQDTLGLRPDRYPEAAEEWSHILSLDGDIQSIASRRVRPSENAMVRTLPDGSVVVLDLGTERYFGLDEVAGEMWAELTSASSVGEARERLLATFDVTPDQLDADLTEFVGELRSRGLITIEEQPVS